MKEKVYLFKDDFGEYAGYTSDKYIKKMLLKQRVKFGCICVSMEAAKHEEYIYENKEYYDTMFGVIMNGDEEDFFVNSFEQFKSDICYTEIDDFVKLIDCMRLNKKEKIIMDNYIQLLNQFKDMYAHGVIDEMEYDYTSVFRYNIAYKYFIKNTLGYKTKK